jgi:hypothetical protein
MQLARTARAVEVLRLHTDDHDYVWYGDDDQLAINTFLGAQDFFESCNLGCSLEDVKCIRFLGTQANAPLVIALQKRRAANPVLNKKQRIQLCAPSVVPTMSMRSAPEEVLQQLWQPSNSGVLAGLWHDLTNLDVCTYLMIQCMAECRGGDVSDVVRGLARHHPAWVAVAYLQCFDYDAACRLITEIVDPRWYRHPFRPNRGTRLYSHLGLTPRNMAAYLGEDTAQDRHFDRAALAVAAWYNVQRPTNGFLWRQFRKFDDRVKGLLRCTQRFIDFLRSVWVYGVSPTHPEASFNPDMFFGDEIEARCFDHFRSSWAV